MAERTILNVLKLRRSSQRRFESPTARFFYILKKGFSTFLRIIFVFCFYFGSTLNKADRQKETIRLEDIITS